MKLHEFALHLSCSAKKKRRSASSSLTKDGLIGAVTLAVEVLEDRRLMSLTPAPTSGFPYNSIVEISATFPDHQRYVGSGAIVDRFHVLTAGHMIYSYADGGWASQVTVTPELNGSHSPYGSASVTNERTYNTWINYNKTHPHSTAPGDNDIALLTLNRTLGDSTGWMAFGTNTDSFFNSRPILNTAGYPASHGYSGQQMYFSSGRTAGTEGPGGAAIDYYQSSITTYGGQSGSPVWAYFPATHAQIIYGVVAGGGDASNSLNFSTRITTSIFNDLQNWRNSDHVPAARSLTVASAQSFGLTTNVNSFGMSIQTDEVPGSDFSGAILPAANDGSDDNALELFNEAPLAQSPDSHLGAIEANGLESPIVASTASFTGTAYSPFNSIAATSSSEAMVAPLGNSLPRIAPQTGKLHDLAVASLMAEESALEAMYRFGNILSAFVG